MKRLENRYVNITKDELLAAAGPLTSQRISGSAAVVKEYESKLSTLFGIGHAVALNSGTVSIYCAMRALGIGPGDEVIMAPTAVVMSALPVSLLGAKTVFADTTREAGFGLDVQSVERYINKNTKAVVSVPLWGYPVPMTELAHLCKDRGLHLIEDIAQAHGTKWNGKYLGTFGSAGCMSTHERKLITTGEGGVVLTNDPDVAQKVNTLRRYGLHPEGIGVHLGLNFKLPAVSAALGCSQVDKLEKKIAERNVVAKNIRDGLSSVSWIKEIPVLSEGRCNYYGMVLQVDEGIDVKGLEVHLEARGVVSDTWRYGYKALWEYPLFVSGKNNCPNAEKLIPSVITVPSHEGMSLVDQERVVESLKTFN